jgi:hypothetical protein
MDLVFIIFVAVSGVILFLAMQQAKIKKQIEENRRQLGDPTLPGASASDPMTPNPLIDPPPGPSSHHSPDAGGHHGGHDAGGGFDGGGGHH